MKAVFNAREHGLKEWTSLLLRADPEFKTVRVDRLASSPLALIEVSWDKKQHLQGKLRFAEMLAVLLNSMSVTWKLQQAIVLPVR